MEYDDQGWIQDSRRGRGEGRDITEPLRDPLRREVFYQQTFSPKIPKKTQLHENIKNIWPQEVKPRTRRAEPDVKYTEHLRWEYICTYNAIVAVRFFRNISSSSDFQAVIVT